MAERFKRPTRLFDKTFHSTDASRCRKEFFRDSQVETILTKFCRTGVLDQPNLNRPTIVGDELPGDLSDSLALATAQRENGGFEHVEESQEKINEKSIKSEGNNGGTEGETK